MRPIVPVRAILSFGALLLMLAIPIRAAATEPDVIVTIGTSSIHFDAIRRLFSGIYQAAGIETAVDIDASLSGKHIMRRDKIIDTVDRAPRDMPLGFRFVYYAGRDPKSEREIIWQSTEAMKTCVGAPECSPDDEFVAAYALAALDADYVDGEPWRTLYRSASDMPSRLALGKAIASAIDAAADEAKKRGAADSAWISQHVAVGMTRRDVYAALRSHGLIAYNYAYAIGIPLGLAGGLPGCDMSDKNSAQWPYLDEPLPKRIGPCATLASSSPEPSPSAYITLGGGFTMACGSEATVALDFDLGDKLKTITIGKFEWSCI